VTVTELQRDRQGIIIVWGRLEGPLGSRKVRLSTANEAPEQGYRLRVRHFEALGFGFHDFGSTRTSFRITASQTTNEWHTQDKLAKLAARAVSQFSPELAADVLTDLRRFAGAAEAENAHRRTADAASPVISMPSSGGPSVATDSH